MNCCRECTVDVGLVMAQCYACEFKKLGPEKVSEKVKEKKAGKGCLDHLPVI